MKLARTAAALPLAAALVLGGSLAASASASTGVDERPATGASGVQTQEVWEYTGKDYFWQSDCTAEGDRMLAEGYITKYRCDGSESPVDDYSLFVVWNK